MFSRAVRWPVLRRRATASGRAASRQLAWRASTSARSGRIASRSIASSRAAPRRADLGRVDEGQRVALEDRVARRDRAARARCRRASAAITCSIFIASITSTGWPARTVSPSPTDEADDGALHRRAQRAPCRRARRRRPDGSTTAPTAGAASVLAERQHRQRIGAVDPQRRRAWPARSGRRSRACDARRGSPTSSPMCSSTKRVCAWPASTSGWRSRACRKAMLVGAPAMRNSRQRAIGLGRHGRQRRRRSTCTITLASSESKRGLVR